MDTMRSLAMTLVLFFLLIGFTRSEDKKDPRAHPNLSPFEKWGSAYECVQNTSSNCSDKYQLKSVGWVNVTAEDGAGYCKDGCSNHTMYQLKCLDDVMRGKYLFENKLTVKDINYTITKGCLSGFTGKVLLYSTSNARMIQASVASTSILALLVWVSISYKIL